MITKFTKTGTETTVYNSSTQKIHWGIGVTRKNDGYETFLPACGFGHKNVQTLSALETATNADEIFESFAFCQRCAAKHGTDKMVWFRSSATAPAANDNNVEGIDPDGHRVTTDAANVEYLETIGYNFN